MIRKFSRFFSSLRPLCLCVSHSSLLRELRALCVRSFSFSQFSTFNFQLSARLAASTFLLCLAFSPALRSQVPSGRDVVKPEVYASLDPAARGSSFQIAVVMKIRSGFHVNAHEKSDDYLIATDLKATLPAGFTAGEVSYPKGKLEKFAFTKIPLNVYQDTVILRLLVTALADAPLGEQHLPLKLRYQACSNELCLPPVTLTLDAALNVAAAAAAAKPAHTEIFGKQ
jgi:thiol:disulfide interchange protein DsbD